MNVVYAAEKTSIAELLGNYVKEDVRPEEISVFESPSETGSFLVGWRLNRYLLSPGGEIQSENVRRFGTPTRERPPHAPRPRTNPQV
jgi:hypothetical protein